MRKVLTASGDWRPVGSIMPVAAPLASDPRGETTPFHGRYRGPHNTGVPDKSALGLPRFGGKFTTPDQTYSDQHFIGYVEIDATGIVFERCYFEGRGDIYAIFANQLVTLIDCEVWGSKARENAVVVSGLVNAKRCHIWGGGNDNISFADGSKYEDCYLHGSYDHFATHADVVQIYGNSANLTLRRCKLMGYNPTTGIQTNSAIQMGSLTDPLTNVEITDNYLDGGGFTLNGFSNTGASSNITITGNRWGRHAAFGPISGTAVPSGSHGTFGNNLFDNVGTTVWP